ncbi:hypothetical protein [Massilia endophytica]|uniref:hypothetical protein n=1 Tax=Massilia endophytica TaxID=2899220 RepID=UPI001E56B253|nr:hypothetical protein [Massilia endophytica]UGQ44612.1 hypothetical protein LSQ66_12415 [Massilia endophytica]
MKSILLASLLALSTLARAADYSGTWALDKSRSKLPPPYERVRSHILINTQTPTRLNVMVEMDAGLPEKDKTAIVYPLDGSVLNTESKIRMQQGQVSVPATVTGSTDAEGGVHFLTKRTIPMGGQQITSNDAEDWSLSADGNVLTVRRSTDSPRGKLDYEMVFVRQQPAAQGG